MHLKSRIANLECSVPMPRLAVATVIDKRRNQGACRKSASMSRQLQTVRSLRLSEHLFTNDLEFAWCASILMQNAARCGTKQGIRPQVVLSNAKAKARDDPPFRSSYVWTEISS